MTKERGNTGKAVNLKNMIEYGRGAIVSKTVLEKKHGDLSVFAFDAGQGLSEHTSPYEAVVQVLDGEALLTVGGKPVRVKAGELAIMPATVPHAVTAKKRFKMLLTLVK